VVHVLYKGKIVRTGGYDLVESIEQNGFDFLKTEE
jgi:Fe-S cluster assembly ATPase SufC